MSLDLTRREFVALAGGAAASLIVGQNAPAAEKSARWLATVRDAMLAQIGQPDCWTALKVIGAEGVEAVIGEDLSFPGLKHPEVKYTAADAAGSERVAADARAAGQKITAFCMFNRFAERPDFEVEWGTRVARAAQALGVPAVRIDVVPGKLERKAFLEVAIAALKKLMAATADTGVRFGIENHGNTTNDPDVLTAIFDGVGSERLGLTLDTGNFYWFGHPLSKLYGLYERFAARAVHTHCKSIRYPAEDRERERPMGFKYGEYNGPIYDGDIDFARVTAILKKAGYTGDLCIENESLKKHKPEEAAEILRKEIALLKKLRG